MVDEFFSGEENDENPHNIEYNKESINLLLETAKSEYDNEHNRTSVIDTKTNISLPIISGLFLVIAPLNNYKQIFQMQISNFWESIPASLLFLSYTAALVFSFIAVLFMVGVISTKQYSVINPVDLFDNDYMKFDERVLKIKLITLYTEAEITNQFVNDRRVSSYRKSWKFATVSIICFAIYAILNNYFIVVR